MKERQGRCICRREERCRRGGDDKDVRGGGEEGDAEEGK